MAYIKNGTKIVLLAYQDSALAEASKHPGARVWYGYSCFMESVREYSRCAKAVCEGLDIYENVEDLRHAYPYAVEWNEVEWGDMV